MAGGDQRRAGDKEWDRFPRADRGDNCAAGEGWGQARCQLGGGADHGGEVREPLDATDEDDLNTFKQLTAQGLAQTGYQKVRSGIGGAFLRWAYTHRGIVAYLTEW